MQSVSASCVNENITIAPTAHKIIIFTTLNQVFAIAAKDAVIAFTALDAIGATVTKDPVVAAITIKRIGAVFTQDRVVFFVTFDLIITAGADKGVDVRAATSVRAAAGVSSAAGVITATAIRWSIIIVVDNKGDTGNQADTQ